MDTAAREQLADKSGKEPTLLQFAEPVEPSSRLSCQIKVSDELDGLIVRMPESQH